MGKLSRTKGASYERHVASVLRPYYPNAKRGLGQARAGHEVDDVEGTPFWVQCKHGQRPNLLEALSQADRDRIAAGDLRPSLVIARKNGGADVVCLRLADFLELLPMASLQASIDELDPESEG